jgi:putative chitinase
MSLQQLQQKIGVKPDGTFGPKTLRAARDYFNLTNTEAAHFFGQCAHESGDFRIFSENMNYSAAGLMRVWPQRFQTMSVALAYAGDPEAIANRVYGGRMGNGPVSSGDGWRFRGRGAIQLTGRDNYRTFAASGFPNVMEQPDLLAGPLAFESAFFFFERAKLWSLAKVVDDTAIEAVRRKINGGTNGLADAAIKTRKFYTWLHGAA